MKLKRFLSGALAAAVALTTMALAPFTTASAADEPYVVIVYTGYNPEQVTIAEGTADASMAGATKVKITFNMGANAGYNQMTSLDVNAVIGENTTAKTSLKGSGWPANGQTGLSNTLTLSAPVAEGEDYVIGASTKNWEKCTTEDNFVFGITKVEFLDDSGNVLKTQTTVKEEPPVEIIASGDVSATCSNAQFTLDSNGVLTISGTGSISAMGQSSYNWYQYRSQVKELVIEEGITDYEKTAFYPLSMLEKATFPTTITKIYQGTFNEYTSWTIEVYLNGKIESCTSPVGNGMSGNAIFYVYDKDSFTVVNAGKGYKGTTVVYVIEGDFVDSGKCGDNATWTLDSTTGILTISGTGDMYSDFTSIDKWEYAPYVSYIKKIVVEDGITSIGASAFRTTGVTSVELPSSITKIGDNAFYQCTALTSITIPDNCSLGTTPFRYCSALETVTIGTGINSLGNRIFGSCTSLKDIYIYSKNLATVTGAALTTATFDVSNNPTFHIYKNSATETTLTDGGYLSDSNVEYFAEEAVNTTLLINAINDASAYDSSDYTEESYKALTDAVEKGNEVLANEEATQDEVNAAVQAINDAINGLVELTVVTGQCGDEVYWSFDKTTGVLTISGTGDMYDNTSSTSSYNSWGYSKYADSIKEAVIEEGVTTVGACAFGPGKYSAINTTTFPNLTKITLPSTIEKIGDYAFAYSLIENLTVPSGVTEIAQYAYYSTKIENVELNENVVLGAYAFGYCSSLKELTLPKGITYSGSGNYGGGTDNCQFSNCTALEKVTILGGGTVSQKSGTYENGLGWDLFDYCTSLSEVIIKCDDLANVAAVGINATFPTNGTNITYTVIKGSTTETTLRNAGYLTDDNVVYSLDYTEFTPKIAEAEAVDGENYTAESYAVLTAALETANAVKENPDATQDDVDAAIEALTSALDALEALDVDSIKASLEELTGDIEKLLTIKDESDYSADSWTAVSEALTAAEEALESEEALTYKEYSALYDALSDAYSGLTTVSKEDSEYIGTIYGGYEVTYNHETDSYKVVVSDDVDMDKVVGTTYVKITLTPNTADLQYQLAYGTLNIWNFLDNLQQYKSLNATEDNVFTYNLSVPTSTSAFSLTAGTGWTKDTEVFYVKSVDFYNANNELLYTYTVDSIGVGNVRELTNAIETAESVDSSTCTEESAKLLALVIEEAKAVLDNSFATKADYNAKTSELEAAIAALEYLAADYTAVDEAIAKIPADLSVYTDESVASLNEAVNAVVRDLDITEQETVDSYAEAIEAALAGLEVKSEAGTVSGTIYVSDEEAKTEMTVTAVSADGTEVSTTATSMGTYTFDNLTVGDYTLTVSGGKYAPRSYEITVEAGIITQDVELNPYGDINGDGKVTTADVGLANSHAKGVKTLTDYDFVCGDVNNDGSISTADVGLINSHAKAVKTLW